MATETATETQLLVAASGANATPDADAATVPTLPIPQSLAITVVANASDNLTSRLHSRLPLRPGTAGNSRTRAPSTARTRAPARPSELSDNHYKLLYLISLYAVAANSTKQNERWIRHIPLLVLMFEGIVRGVFDFDYAPASVRLSFKGRTLRRWINVSREGQAAIDDLWELGLVNGLKLSSDDFQPITAYQVSVTAGAVLARVPLALRREVERLVFTSDAPDRQPVQIVYDGKRFHLKSGVVSSVSAITESEDVSYVSSPFLPQCLRAAGFYRVELRSNASRAAESAVGVSSISKQLTSEALTLGDVYALVGEWVPFGSNQIVALNERMGALDRCQGGILTSFVDGAPTDAQFRVPVGQTQVRILDFDFVRFINFEAESHFPETSGIVQVEHFGMHLNSDGSLIYGIKVEAILERQADDISIDHLARLLVDVHQDSSMLVNDLLSQYQLSLLEMLYLGDSFQRNKYNCVLATSIRPKLRHAREYLERASLSNELAQILGDVHASHDLSDDDVLLVGKAGILACGPNIFRFEHVLTVYLGLVCRDIFIKNFFARTFVLDATLKDIRQLVHTVPREPAVAVRVREQLAGVSKDTILLAETLEYLLDSLEELRIDSTCSSKRFLCGESDAAIEARVVEVLALQQLKTQTLLRCHDSIKLMENTMLQLEQLQKIFESTMTNQLELACQRLHLNTKELLNATRFQQATRLRLEVLQYVVTGLFVFDVLDRLLGGPFHVHLPRWALDWFVTPLLSRPFLWWTIVMTTYALCVCGLRKLSLRLALAPLGWTSVYTELLVAIDVERLHKLLRGRTVRRVQGLHAAARPETPSERFRVVAWEETDARLWRDAPPHVEVLYDEKHAFLVGVALRFDAKRSALGEADAIDIFRDLLVRHQVLQPPAAPATRRASREPPPPEAAGDG
ncbi:hypothetical protein P43SY_004057 [Pythium insidiosum]|uniref:Uncharacterized protein n=1 Tax=Pythium insidiosum TaxID=114742 RepID=A0AAD5LG17_PYTIN|nr:hypothetical protein P43SY_004057 [Pythium insidiosum]